MKKSLKKKSVIAIDASRSNTYGSKRFIKTILDGLNQYTELKVLLFVSSENFNFYKSSRVSIIRLKTKKTGLISILNATILIPIKAYLAGASLLYSPWDIGPIINPLPFILGIHSPNSLTPKKYKSQKIPWLHEKLTKISAKKSIGVEFPSYTAADQIGKHLDIDLNKRKVIHHGAELSKWKEISSELERSNSTNPYGAPYFISWSWFYRAKNIETLIAAFHSFINQHNEKKQELNRWKLILAGKFYSDQYQKEVFDLIKRLSLSDRIIFIEQPSDQELVKLIYHSSAMVIPSLYETFGFMYVEGRVMDKPFIVADTEVAREVTESQCIYFDGLSSKDLASKLKEVKINHEEQKIDYKISKTFYEESARELLAEYFNSFFITNEKN